MPRGRKKAIVEKDFEKLINDAQKKIDDAKHKIETEKAFISEQKKMIKQLQKEKVAYEECQTAHCGRGKSHFIFGGLASPIVPYRNLTQTTDGITADCRSLV